MKCSKCKKHTPTHAFATFRQRSGEVGRRGICKGCRGQYAKDNFSTLKKWRTEYNKKNRTKKAIKAANRRRAARDLVDSLKSSARCHDCGGIFPAVAMDFDHVHGKKKSIANMVSQAYKIEFILEEIKLCELVCACCHRVRTAERKQNHAPHRS